MPEYIGVYRLESPLGKGGMGEVFLAWDERLERRVAIKRVRRDVFTAPHQRDRFRREARMAARLSHAAIVQIHDLVIDESGDAIVMEYVEGITLAEQLVRGLASAEAVGLAREIAQGLAAAHSAGLIHRDLKAENVIVTPAGHAKILDFGLARPVDSEEEQLTQQGAIVGTSYAMSPEQASGEELDERSDLFSLGTLLYEMLAGRSPFRGKNSLGTLKRVLTEQPPPLASVRPDLPHGLTALVDRLLAKNRDERPGSAAEVASRLERIERELLEGAPEPEETMSDQPTAAFPAVPWTRLEEAAAPVPVAGSAPLRVGGWILLLAALLVVAAGISLLLDRREPEPALLRVLVLKPKVDAEDRGLALTASGVLSSAVTCLGRLEGIAPIEPTQVAGAVSSPREAARNAAAQEILVSTIEREGSMARVSLRRVQADEQVLEQESFSIYPEPKELYLLTDRLCEKLGSAYPGFAVRPGSPPRLLVRDQDYAAFLEIRLNLELGKPAGRSELDRLDRLLESSPRFLEARIQAARLAVALFRSTRDPADLGRARSYVEGAREIAPDDVRTLREIFNVALCEGHTEEAATNLSRLEKQIAGDPDLLFLRYRLLEKQGRRRQAEAALRAAVERAPSWRHIYWLAHFETQRGRVKEARKLIGGLLEQSPGNVWAREQLAYLELTSGDLQKARQIYEELARSDPKPSYFNNIGLALSLEKRYRDAREAYQRALSYSPGHIKATLNFANVQLSLGDQAAAQALYGSVLRALKDNEPASGPAPDDRLVEAQCLAHLGQADRAREAVRLAMREQPDDPESLFQASLVYAVLGDRRASAAYGKAALDHGLSPHWFSDSAFDALRKEESFQALLGSSGG